MLAGKVDEIELFAMFAIYSCYLIGKMFKWCWQNAFNVLVMKLITMFNNYFLGAMGSN